MTIYEYDSSDVHTRWKWDQELLDALEKMPDFFYKKSEYINWIRKQFLSFEKQDGFYEVHKNSIKEPNINFCNLIKELY